MCKTCNMITCATCLFRFSRDSVSTGKIPFLRFITRLHNFAVPEKPISSQCMRICMYIRPYGTSQHGSIPWWKSRSPRCSKKMDTQQCTYYKNSYTTVPLEAEEIKTAGERKREVKKRGKKSEDRSERASRGGWETLNLGRLQSPLREFVCLARRDLYLNCYESQSGVRIQILNVTNTPKRLSPH